MTIGKTTETAMHINTNIKIRLIDTEYGFKAPEQALVGLEQCEFNAVVRKGIVGGANRVAFCHGIANGRALLGKRNQWGVSRPHHDAKFPAAMVVYLKESSYQSDEEHKAKIPSPHIVKYQLVYRGLQVLGAHMTAKKAIDGKPDTKSKVPRASDTLMSMATTKGANSPRFVSGVVVATNGKCPVLLVGLTS